jgi:uncharacterized membrane protein
LVEGEPLRDDGAVSAYVPAMKSQEKVLGHVLTVVSCLLLAAFVGGFIATILLLLLDAVFGWSSGWVFVLVWGALTALLARVFLSEELPLLKDE